ncbi:hypothetical protein TH53_15100 [Pedobacter lusitanus]|uniref:Uncharacterized protein n=2 Tax=Pedobacter lusitanus TaxID=1503925 RepID=A0A0D0GJU5_9SPHI|nr:hypothetical protein TH53_15100 [Pedobacter lusitanus]
MILDNSGQASSIAPVNFAILDSGIQKLDVGVFPHSGETVLDANASMSYKVKLYDVSYGFEFKHDLLAYKFPATDPRKQVPYSRKSDQFDAQIPYELEGWRKGVHLKGVEDVELKLKRAYARLAQSINAKRYDQFEQALANREHIMATSMYLNKHESARRISNLVKDFEDGFELMPLASDAVFHYYADGKMAAFKRLNGEPAMFLQNQEKQEELSLDLLFYIPEGKTEFEVI